MGLRRIRGLALAGLVTTTTLATTSTALAAGGAGTPVLAFGSCGVSRASLALQDGGTGSSGVVVLPDGKMVIGGGTDGATLYRLLPDGTLDVTFGTNGGTVTPLLDPETGSRNTALIRETAAQPDGRILLAGSSYRRTPTAYHLLVLRYLADGSPDPTFGVGGQVALPELGIAQALGVQPDGKVLAATGQTVVRLDQAGRLDPTFGSGGIARDALPGFVTDMVVQADGRIVLGFGSYAANGIGVTRLLADGSPDPGFGAGGTATVGAPARQLLGVALDTVGRILTAGSSVGLRGDLSLTRHLPDGTLDPTFGTGGIAQVPFPGSLGSTAVDLVVQADGKPVVAAQVYVPPDYENNQDIGLARLTADGQPDPSFGAGGFTLPQLGGHDGFPTGLAATADGGWVLAGIYDGPIVLRYRGDGASSVENPALTPSTCARQATLTGPEDFGTRVIHTASGLHTFTLTATGPRPVVVQRVGLSENTGQFVVRSTTCVGARLVPGASCTVSVDFQPTVPRSYYGAVIVWTDTGESWQAAAAYGIALATPIGWGWNGLGQLGSGGGAQSLVAGAPTGLGHIAALSAGYHHTLALADYGTVYAWGWNHYGQTGTGCNYGTSCEPALEPRPVALGMNLHQVTAVAAGGFHSLALLDDGTVQSWGLNNVGQLGHGNTNPQVVPYPVSGLTDVVAISAGIYHSLAVKSDGSVWAWGWNHFGQLGDGTTVDRLVPTRVPGLVEVTAVAGGGYHSLALADGKVQAWGMNHVGQLGDGTTVDRLQPVAASGLAAVSAIAAGGFHSLAITGAGVSTWGWNAFGQLGDGTTANRAAPLRVAPGTAAAGGLGHTVALQSDGTVTAWGWNVLGQLGDGSTTTRTTPVAVVGMIGATLVAAGALHSLAE